MTISNWSEDSFMSGLSSERGTLWFGRVAPEQGTLRAEPRPCVSPPPVVLFIFPAWGERGFCSEIYMRLGGAPVGKPHTGVGCAVTVSTALPFPIHPQWCLPRNQFRFWFPSRWHFPWDFLTMTGFSSCMLWCSGSALHSTRLPRNLNWNR